MVYDIVLDDLPVRSLESTPVALGLSRWGEGRYLGPAVLALDAEHDEFVRLPLDPSRHGEMLALAHDGRHLLVRGPTDDIRTRFVVGIYTLGTGDLRFYDDGPDGADYVASLSPDGRDIATLVCADNEDHVATWTDDPYSSLAAVSLIDVSTGDRRRIWTGPAGGWGAESTIRWSPDGAHIAVNYLKWIDEIDDSDDATVVIERDGTLVDHIADSMIPQSNGAWLDDTELAIIDTHSDTTENLSVVDVRTGSRRTVGGVRSLINAVLDDRLIMIDTSVTDRYRLASYRFDGTDEQPFITVPPRLHLFDIAPMLLAAQPRRS